MEKPDPISSFWSGFLAATSRPADTPLYDAFHFGDREASADTLADLVLRVEKVATSSLFWDYEVEGKRPPRPGDLSVITRWDATPVCVVETTDVTIRPFEEVDGEFAAAEGEGDRSLAFWRRTHWAFFGRVCAELGREPSPRMPIVCERFVVLHRCAGFETV